MKKIVNNNLSQIIKIEMEKSSFLSKATKGINIVRETYPTALLLEIDSYKSEGTTLNPDELDQMRIVFSYEDRKSISIHTLVDDTFEEPIVHDSPFTEDVIIQQFPINMDLPEALQLIKEAGLEEPFDSITLRHPLAIGFDNILYYVGQSHIGRFVSVDTVTKEVKQIENMLGEQWFSLTICTFGVSINGYVKIISGKKPAESFTFNEGTCTDTEKFVSKAGFYGTEGTLDLRIDNGQKENAPLICKVSWISPYKGENKFNITDQSFEYDIKITGRGTSGEKKGALGSCSMLIIKN